MIVRYLSAIPAYGRDYRPGEAGEAAIREDWANHKDFLIQDVMEHGYVNIDDKPPHVQLNIRYNRLQDICVIEADEGDEIPETPHFLDMEDGPTLLD